jgi:hypothetical protein
MAKNNSTRKNFNPDGTRNTAPFILGWWENGRYVEKEVTPLTRSKLDTDDLIANRRREPDYSQAPTTRELEDLAKVLGGGQ